MFEQRRLIANPRSARASRTAVASAIVLLAVIGCSESAPGSATTAPSSTTTSVDGEVPAVATGEVNLRSGPGTDHAIVGRLPAQSTFTVSCSNGEWMQLSKPTMGAYVHGSLLTLESVPRPCPTMNTPTPLAPETVIVPPETVRETVTLTTTSSRPTTPTSASQTTTS
jgi:uncharacterized protein YraI